LFTLAGYRVTVFADGESFVVVAGERSPVAVLLDLDLPDRSGLAVLREIDAPHFPTPILIVSGDGDVGYAVDAVKNRRLRLHCQAARSQTTCPRRRRHRRLSQAPWRQQDFFVRVCRPSAADAARARDAGANHCRRLQQGSRPPSRHHRAPSRLHRARIVEKIGARNTADLVRIALGGGTGGGRNMELAADMVA
jgi:two-component system response regulator FixJ